MAAPRTRPYTIESRDPASDVVVPGDLHAEPTLWRDVFGNERPVEVEIGCAKGTFLLAAAQATPERNFMGLERSVSLAAAAQAALNRAQLDNARVLCCDARCVVMHLIPPNSVAGYHLYFPDPWWKRRHHKRRVYSAGFAAAVARTLRPRGQIAVATDVPGVLAVLERRFTDAGLRPAPARPASLSTTFASRCIEGARPVHHATFVRE